MSETWHGIVHSIVNSGIYVTIPRLMGKEVLGPCLTAVPALAVGDRVVGAKIGDELSDLIILTRPVVATVDESVVHKDGNGNVTLQNVYLNGSAVPENKAVTQAALDTKAPVVHRHPWADLDNVPASFTPSAHTHPWTEVTDKPATFAPSAHRHPWSELDDVPASFAPSAHTHPWADVTGKPTTFAPSAHRHPWSDLDNVPATFAPMAHAHPSTDISDSTSIGRGLLIAQTAAGARTVIGAMDAARTFTKADVGLGSVDNTSDLDKPLSNAAQTAFGSKAELVHTHALADVTGLETALDAVETTAWTTLTMINSWVAYTGGGNYFQGLRARRVGKNVQIQGMVKNGAMGTIIAHLPLDLTPLNTALLLAVVGNASTPRTAGYIVIVGKGGAGTAGNITYDSGISAPTFLDIDVMLPLANA